MNGDALSNRVYSVTAYDGNCPSAPESLTITVNPLPTVTLEFPTSANVNPNGPVITVPLNQGLFFTVYGGGANAQYERKVTMAIANGSGIFAVDNNDTGRFPLNLPGPFNIVVTDDNGCSRTITGEIK